VKEMIDTLIRVLERLKDEDPLFQEDALWKLGSYISAAIDVGEELEEEELYRNLREFHERIRRVER